MVVEPPKPVAETIEMAPGHVRPPADWWAALETEPLRHSLSACAGTGMRCLVLQLPLENAQQGAVAALNPLVCRTGRHTPNCEVFARNVEGLWYSVGVLRWQGLVAEQREQLAQAIAQGRLQVQTPRWMEAGIPGDGMPAGRLRD